MAKTTFQNGPEQRFEASEQIKYNGVDGVIWIDRRLAQGGWMHMGKKFMPLRSTQAQVIDAFDCVDRREQVNAQPTHAALGQLSMEINMIKTYAVKTEDGKIHYMRASSARQARIVFERGHNEKIVSVNICKE